MSDKNGPIGKELSQQWDVFSVGEVLNTLLLHPGSDELVSFSAQPDDVFLQTIIVRVSLRPLLHRHSAVHPTVIAEIGNRQLVWQLVGVDGDNICIVTMIESNASNCCLNGIIERYALINVII